MKLICGIGINDVPNSSSTKEYYIWSGLFSRCYNKKAQELHPSYSDCDVSGDFLVFSKFKKWYENQIGYIMGFEIDKDLILKNNREYHPDKCILLPKEINSFLRTRSKSRGDLPIGVCKVKNGGFKAQLNNGVEKKYLGCFPTPEQAFQAYKQAKEAHIKVLANKYKDQIDPRAYDALMNYKVEITD